MSTRTAAPPGVALTDSTGTRRRWQALIAVGYTGAELAVRLGPSHRRSFRFTACKQVPVATAEAMRALYDQLWDVPPPETTRQEQRSAITAREGARRRGWPPPMGWDDDEIDDPAAGPAEGWRRPGRSLPPAEFLEEVSEMLPYERDDRDLVAERMGMTKKALEKRISRAQRALAA